MRKGFRRDDTHHRAYWLYVNGRKSAIRTRISHGAAEYDANLLGQVKRQLRLTNPQFEDFVACPLDAEGYLQILRDRGFV